MGFKAFLTFLNTIFVLIYFSHGCEMENVGSWMVPQSLTIEDVFSGQLFSSPTSSIAGINSINVFQTLQRGPYFIFEHTDSLFTIRTDDSFVDYEEYETDTTLSITTVFNCVGGTIRSMVFVIGIIDTNNHDPLFRPSSELEFTVMPPLPPGFEINSCLQRIYARDVDLTTQRVDFEVYDSPYFEIEYDAESSTTAKEFNAKLRTTTFIRSIPEPLVFRISATDVDQTNDPSRTTFATVRIVSDGEFELPEELAFSQTFYLATYTEDHQVNLQDTISLRQGYHEEVQFSLAQEYQQYFTIVRNVNQISIGVINQLPVDLLRQQQILIVVYAERSYTTGASATVILQLPEAEALMFQQQNYEGTVEDNVLQLSELILTQGYSGETISVNIISDHASYFSYTIQENRITLSMTPLPSAVLEQNNFLNLQVVASTGFTTVSTIVTLDIVTDDSVTPVFQRSLYEGTYDLQNGLTLEQIVMIQGYDNSVQVALRGDHEALFQMVTNGPNINLNVLSIPTELFREGSILLTLEASKPRTVGANTAISITLPAETQLAFEQQNYEGTIEDNVLQLTQLTLSEGYDIDPVSVFIQTGSAHASYFTAAIQDNRITISMSPLSDDIIESNTFLNLEVVAATDRSSASAIVTLEIIKDDNLTPVFERSLYEGTYDSLYGLTLEEIVLVQGYDDTVQLELQGEHASFFQIVQEGRYIRLSVASLPETLYAERNLFLSIEATKPRTVGANAAISIALPTDRELRFAAASYSGTIRDNNLNLGVMVLDVGYTEDVTFSLSGEYSTYFIVSNIQNQVSIELQEPIPDIAITENNILLLSLSASALNAVTTSTSIILDIIREDTTTPRFNQDVFFGTYTDSNLDIGPIFLSQGFDSTVSFRLDGVFSQYFGVTNTGNNVAITVQSPIPEQVIFDEKVLTFSIVADKELTVGAAAAISIRFPTELTHPTVLRFSRNIYVGSLVGNSLDLENIVLENGFTPSTEFVLTGDYGSYFFTTTASNNGIVTISTAGLPPEVLNQKFITLELQADDIRAEPVTTTIVIDVVQTVVVPPVFEDAFYRGVYTEATGLQLEREISLSEGFDETVTFVLAGEFSQWFAVSQNNNFVSISVTTTLPEGVLENNNNLLFTIEARKPEATTGRAAISVDLPREVPTPVVLSFAQASYVGQIADGLLDLPPVTLVGDFNGAIQLSATGEFAEYFTLARQSNVITIALTTPLSPQVVETNAFILLDIEASYPEAVSGQTTIVIEVVRHTDSQVVVPVFEQAYYIGQYSDEGGLSFEQTIRLVQGFDETVSFTLAGENSEAFVLVENGQNNFGLSLREGVTENLNDRQQLVFSVVASKPDTVVGRAAIVITLTDLSPRRPLRFAQDYYAGTINNENLSLSEIVLEEGYSTEVQFTLSGDYNNYFQITQQNGVFLLQLVSAIPAEVINNNDVFILTLEAQIEGTRTHTTIVLTILREGSIPLLQFENIYYVGSYSESGLNFNEIISLEEGYDDSVEFVLQGENSQWFGLTGSANSVGLIISNPIPPAVLANNQQLIFPIIAQRLGSVTARATIVIQLNDEITANEILGFDRISYVGSIVNNLVSLGSITLSEGYTPAVTFTLHGDLANFFRADSQGATVSIVLSQPIPQESVPSSGLILLELQASALPALPAFATIVLEVVQDDEIQTVSPVFAETFYVGSYSASGSFSFESVITLTEGYGPSITFTLQGEQSQWFDLVRFENSVSLVLTNPIPPAVVANNQQLLFTITAQSPGSTIARATIIVQLIGEVAADEILGFDFISYVGSIENNAVSLSPITLREGYSSDVTFNLYGDLANYFRVNSQGALVTILLNEPIPQDILSSNGIILLELQASGPPALPAVATIVLEVVREEVESLTPLAFSESFYVGSYSVSGSFVFESTITLAEGYDSTTTFSLEGEQAQWFDHTSSENSVTLILSSPIPAAVIANNQQLIFIITAQRADGTTTRATIIIQLIDEMTAEEILGFDRVNYVGSLLDNTVNMGPITLSEGYTSAVLFTLHGDLADYFRVNSLGASVTIVLYEPIPQGSIPSNGVILLELQASASQVLPAYATIVLEVVQDNINQLIAPVFAESFYVGSYSTSGSFVFESTITLTEGYDPTITFALEGEQAQWFNLISSGNSVSLSLSSPVPPAVIANNQQLIFIITAQRPESTIASATIIIQLNGEITTDVILGFDRINYIGTIEENSVNLGTITLSEGYTSAVAFTLHGDLANYFSVSSQGAIISIEMNGPILQPSLPSNGVILLELQASSPPALPAFATIVLQVVQEDEIPSNQLIFAETFYVGSYLANGSFSFDSVIMLAEGYDLTVAFALEGEQAQWFDLTQSGNSVSLVLSSPIPPAVIANNQQMLFVINAQRPGSATARATIVIQLINDDTTIEEVLGFDRINYIGEIVNNSVDLPPITLEGYTSSVSFTLLGDLANYFRVSAQESAVSITLYEPIPQESLPSNGVILLELQASTPSSVPALATIILEVVQDEEISLIPPVFAETFYVGSYSSNGTFVFDSDITLSEGYDSAITFSLQGEQSQWFDLVRSENLVTLILSSPIPPAVIANNQQLIFRITAQRLESSIASATIVIQLFDENIATDEIIGFDRINYVGTIVENTVNLGPISLEGYTTGVTYMLHGDLSNYFSVNPDGAVVAITLNGPIPQDSLPSNRLVLLELQASAPSAAPAFATIVLEVVVVDETPTTLVFAETFYVGSYSSNGSFVFDSVILLAEGYDPTVTFTLEGEQSQWFDISRSDNSVSLTLTSTISPAVVANYQQLLFSILAQRPGSPTARATIVIQLIDEITTEEILGFDRINYVGRIVDNNVDLSPITLVGYSAGVTFSVFGDLSSYFTVNSQGAVVSISLNEPIPVESLPSTRVILLELQASLPSTAPAFATVVLEVVQDDETPLTSPVFAESFYVGSYSASGSFAFDSLIELAEGYDPTITFSLEGEQAQWFGLTRSGNAVIVTLSSPIPPAVIANNQPLLFVITAQRPESTTARATIVIQIINEDTIAEEVLGFDRINYVGTIVDNSVNLGPITLEGSSSGVSFTLLGDLSNYFRVVTQGSVVSISLYETIPPESIPSNGIILLNLQASAPSAAPAFATIILEVVQDSETPLVPPVFAETFYIGSYTASGSFVFDSVITLLEGYDSTITFALEGDQSQWFGFTRSDNTVSLTLTSPIPTSVIANNQQLIFIITAQRAESTTARATIVIQIIEDDTITEEVLGFDRINYVGTIVDNSVNLGPITLEGSSSGVSFTLLGDLSSYFRVNAQGSIVSLSLYEPIPQESIPSNGIILIELQASTPSAVPAFATIILEVVQVSETPLVPPVFAETFYIGSYTANGSLVFDSVLTLEEGYDSTITFALEGDQSQWFGLTRSDSSVNLILTSAVPPAVIANNQQLVFIVTAQRPGTTTASSTIIIQLIDEVTTEQVLGFDRINYIGRIVDSTVDLGSITLEGSTAGVTFTLLGDLANYFRVNDQGSTVSIILNEPIPQESVPSNNVILLELQASAPSAVPAFATIVLEVIPDDEPVLVSPVFENTFYVGSYSTNGNFVIEPVISLAAGYDPSITFILEGDQAQWFGLTRFENSVRLILSSPIPPAVVANNQQLVFTITAQRPGTTTASSTIIIQLIGAITTDEILGFDQVNYVGTIEQSSVNLDPITLSEGYTSSVSFTLHGDLAGYFVITAQGSTVSITLAQPIPAESLPSNRIVLLSLQASAPQALPAFTTIVLEIVGDDVTTPALSVLAFDEAYFIGTYTLNQNLNFDSPITLLEGYDDTVTFTLTGEHASHFILQSSNNVVSIGLLSPLPPSVVADNLKLVLVLSAERPGSISARTTIIIRLERVVSSVYFDKVLYEGIIQSGVVQHETITITGFEGTTIDLVGEYASLFTTSLSNGLVMVQTTGSLTLPADIRHVVLELRAADSGAVLVLDISSTDGPVLPTVSFEASSYALRVEIGQTGLVGRVGAFADNGEEVTYSLTVNNEHLRGRISINTVGELRLSAPANSGIYNFQAVATSVFSQVTAYTTVHLSVEALAVCDTETVTAPLIVLDRDEEEPLRDLVLLSPTEHAGCRFTLTSRWPTDQNWLYVDETGLHASAIDREDPSIAFMALSQVQVELILTCDSDVTRTKRSTNERLEWLGPYDYGTSTWLLGETISFNSRRSIVNLIVNDINDNVPIFVGKENEPIVVGYPITELEETVLPRSLAELQATDADVGVNAALVYWSSEPQLAVSPTTGFVHVNNDQSLEQDMILTVNATDLNGQGHTGSISLMVKLLDSSNIAVITVRDAFLEDERHILGNLSNVIGYEVRALRSVVVSEAEEELSTRMKRDVASTGASLVIYVYGLVQREPVSVVALTTDINNAAVVAVNIARIQSLQDHLDGRLICDNPVRDTGLFVATIVLSILLFLLIVAIIVWFVLRWLKKRNYDQFTDSSSGRNSLVSQSESPAQLPKPLDGLAVAKPRLNFEELKRSEKRLQDMLNAPVEPVLIEPTTSNELNSVTKIPQPDPIAPIVIQDKLKDATDESDDDEFGERTKARRKSVVTFNENVEKIIPVDDEPESDATFEPTYEVYRM